MEKIKMINTYTDLNVLKFNFQTEKLIVEDDVDILPFFQLRILQFLFLMYIFFASFSIKKQAKEEFKLNLPFTYG